MCLRCTNLLVIKDSEIVTLSSSEAEWLTLSKAVKEVMFVTPLLGSMKISVKQVRKDNVGIIFMARNITITSHTKHVDIRY